MNLNLRKILCIAALSMTVGSGSAMNGDNNNDPMQAIQKQIQAIQAQMSVLQNQLALQADPLGSINQAFIELSQGGLNQAQIDQNIRNIKMGFSLLNKEQKPQLYQNFENMQNNLKNSLSQEQYRIIREDALGYWSTWKKVGLGVGVVAIAVTSGYGIYIGASYIEFAAYSAAVRSAICNLINACRTYMPTEVMSEALKWIGIPVVLVSGILKAIYQNNANPVEGAEMQPVPVNQ